MDLISRKSVIDRLTSLFENYRSDTDLGRYCREGVSASIEAVERDNYTLDHLGSLDIIILKQNIEFRIKDLEQEEMVSIYAINGLYSTRHTQDPDKAKAIFLEEVNCINEDDGLNDFLDESFKIYIKKVRESDLPSYVLE